MRAWLMKSFDGVAALEEGEVGDALLAEANPHADATEAGADDADGEWAGAVAGHARRTVARRSAAYGFRRPADAQSSESEM